MQKMIEKLGLSESAASAAMWVVLSLVLLGVVALVALWLVRTLRPSLNIKAGDRGGRPQRLAITDAFALDREGRKLVIVRRDNVEHLLLIGGPNDVLVEGNITRHDRAARGLPRAPEAEPSEDLAPPPAATLPPAMSLPPAPAPVAPPAPPAPPRPRAEDFERPVIERPVLERRPAAPLAPALAPAVTPEPRRAEPPMDMTPPPAPPPAPEPVVAPPPAPPVLTLEALLPDATPVPPPAPPPPPAPEPVVAPAPRAPAMSEMARRLNEALQKPVSGTLRPPFNRSIPPVPPTMRSAPPPPPPPAPPAPEPPPAPVVPEPAPAPEPKIVQAAPEPKIVQAEPEPMVAKADMDLLEEEMARLLGRPSAPKGPGVS